MKILFIFFCIDFCFFWQRTKMSLERQQMFKGKNISPHSLPQGTSADNFPRHDKFFVMCIDKDVTVFITDSNQINPQIQILQKHSLYCGVSYFLLNLIQ